MSDALLSLAILLLFMIIIIGVYCVTSSPITHIITNYDTVFNTVQGNLSSANFLGSVTIDRGGQFLLTSKSSGNVTSSDAYVAVVIPPATQMRVGDTIIINFAPDLLFNLEQKQVGMVYYEDVISGSFNTQGHISWLYTPDNLHTNFSSTCDVTLIVVVRGGIQRWVASGTSIHDPTN